MEWAFPPKLNIQPPDNPLISLWSIGPKDLKLRYWRDSCPLMFNASLFPMDNTHNQCHVFGTALICHMWHLGNLSECPSDSAGSSSDHSFLLMSTVEGTKCWVKYFVLCQLHWIDFCTHFFFLACSSPIYCKVFESPTEMPFIFVSLRILLLLLYSCFCLILLYKFP